mgnify:CR=1 FL=1
MTNKIYVESKIELAENLRKLREKVGRSQGQMAKALHVDRSTYSYYEAGKVLPNIFTLIKISKLLKVDFLNLIITDKK